MIGRRVHPRALATALALMATQGCTPTDTRTEERALPVGTPVAIQDSATLCVGVVTGNAAQEFDRVVTPFLLPDGRLAVPLAGPGEIRLFDTEGHHLATLGGEGEGPGEFSSLNAAWARGDTLEAFDSRLHRITRFLPGGAVEVVSLERIPSAQVAVPGSPVFGWVLTGVADAGMGRRDQVALHRFGREGAHLGEMGRLEGMARYRIEGFSGPDPLSPKTVAAVAGDRIYAAETLTPSIQVFGPDGSRERDVTWSPDTTVSAASAYASVIEAVVARAGSGRGVQTRQRLEAFPRSDRVSVFWGVIVDEAGFLWIRPFDPLQHALELGGYGSPGVGGEWLVLSPTGVALPSIAVPSRLEPVSVTRDAVVGIRRDELGVESVCVHRLERRSGSGGR